MAERATPPRGSMSLIPYNRGSTDIVLRHGAAIVVYDTETRQISLGHDPSHTATDGALLRTDECPTCHRPLMDHSDIDGDRRPQSGSQNETTFTNPDYFRLLSRSLPPSNASTQPPSREPSSPVLRSLPQRAHEGASRSTSGASYGGSDSPTSTLRPPEDAEFLGSAPAPETASQGISAKSFSQGYFEKFFITEKELGKGGKGVVFLVRHMLDSVDLGLFACKRVPVGNDHEWLKKVLIEVQLLTTLQHSNLVQYKHVWLEDSKISRLGPSVPCAFILQQYCNAGDLHSYMLDSARVKVTTEQMKDRLRRRSKGQIDPLGNSHGPRRMNFEDIFSFFKDITSGLHHLHVHGYVHRDLKPSNCLLDRDSAGRLKVLVSDFGEVQVVSARRNSTGSTGTISYCAPEVLRRDALTGGLGNFTTKSDIFSLGMIVYFMCFGRLPYKSADQLEEDNEDVVQLSEEISAWAGFDDHEKQRTDLPDRLYTFLKRLLSIDPAERPSTEAILHSIGAGGDPEDLGSAQPRPHVFDDIKSRVQNIETPSPTPQRMPSERRGSHLPDLEIPDKAAGRNFRYTRPGSSLLRRVSPTKPPVRRGRSPEKHAAYVEGEDSDTDASADAQMANSLTLRTAGKKAHVTHSNIPSPVSPARSPQRLLLPPPPEADRFSVAHLLDDDRKRGVFKLLLFGVKAATLLQPCAPYAPRSLIMYPLLALAALDFVYGDEQAAHHSGGDIHGPWPSLRLSILLLAMHLGTIVTVKWWDGLCPVRSPVGNRMAWD